MLCDQLRGPSLLRELVERREQEALDAAPVLLQVVAAHRVDVGDDAVRGLGRQQDARTLHAGQPAVAVEVEDHVLARRLEDLASLYGVRELLAA